MLQCLFSLFVCVSYCLGLDPIVLKGNQLYNSRTQERFYVKGVAYSPDLYANVTSGGTAINSLPGEDHFTDEKEPLWSKDIPLLRDLGINSVRLYNVDPAKNHDKFMLALENAGIYAVVSSTVTVGPGVLDASKVAVASPPGAGCYTTGLLYSAKLIVRQFAKYNNTLAFVVANEIGQYEVEIEGKKVLKPGYHAIPCVKALVRDLRAYMQMCSCGMRYIPLMYAATDLLPQANGAKPRDLISQYLTCGEHSVDLYGVNIYTWCAYASTFSSKSTYKDVTDAYRNYDVGMVLSEYGCTYGQFENYYPFIDDPTQKAETSQRTWKQIDTLFSANMSDVFSGGFAYQYSMSAIIYGMVLLPGYEKDQPNIKILPNYNYAKQHFTTVVPPAEIAGWTEQSRCDWKPSIFASKTKNTCPTKAQADLLFGGSKFPEVENWSGGMIPPVPPNSHVSCLHYPLSHLDQAENACHGACRCPQIVVEPRCSVDWSHMNMSLPENAAGVTKLLDALCGLLYNYGDQYSETCNAIGEKGEYAGCTDEQKANYILNVWYTYKKQTECCASLFSSATCSQPLEASIITPETTPWRGNAVFNVLVSGGLPPYRYQWESAPAGSDLFQSVNSTTSSFELKQVTSEMIGSKIRCHVWGSAFLSATTAPVSVMVLPPNESRNRLTANGTLAEFSANTASITAEISNALLIDTNLSSILRTEDIHLTNISTLNNDSSSLVFTVVVLLGGPSEGSAAKIESRLITVIADGSLNTQLASKGLALKVTGSAAVCGKPPPAGKNQISSCFKSSLEKKDIDVCSVQCVEGYSGSGIPSYTCQNGGWSRNTYQCSKVEESSSGMPLWAIVVLVVFALLLAGVAFKVVNNYRENQEIKNYQLKKGLINSD